MKFRINSWFNETDEENRNLATYDYDKYVDGRIVEFDNTEELYEFMREATDTMMDVYGRDVTVDLIITQRSKEFLIRFYY